ncbi:MAG: hypothetical protein IT223_05850, partial [Crocinitomicaceae bacterium]|nr:hypothetical protein [Crocinitomicaceae bacterium]
MTLNIDAFGTVYIGGTSYKDGNRDITVTKIKYTGVTQASGRYNSDYNLNDISTNIALNPETGELYIAGQIETSPGSYSNVFTKWKQATVYLPVPEDSFNHGGGYVTNKGQLRDENGDSETRVYFYSESFDPSTYVDDTKISYVWSTHNESSNDTVHRIDMRFLNGNGSNKVYPLQPKSWYANYYLAHMAQPSERTPIYDMLVKKDVYTNTDIIFTQNRSGYRTWIVARFGAPTGSFEMEYDGQNGLSINGSGQLVIDTEFGDHILDKAKAYTLNHTTGELTLLGWQPSYVLSSDEVSFSSFGSWSGTLVLEITQEETVAGMTPESNETLDWSTYIGGNGFDLNRDVVANQNENCWYVGMTESLNFMVDPGVETNFPKSLGDAFIMRFDQNCIAKYVTYYGGSAIDQGWSIDVGSHGIVHIVGYTESSDLGSFSPTGLNDATLNGSNDGFYIRLSDLGYLEVDTYIGGDGEDNAVGVAVQSNNVYIVGNSDDTTNFPVISYTNGYN